MTDDPNCEHPRVLRKALDEQERMEHRVDSLERFQQDIERRFAEAFPGADYLGHCRYHDLMIEQIDARKKLTRAIAERTIGGLVWGMFIGLAIAVWQYVKSMIGKP